MKINEDGKMCSWELQKAGYLLTIAGELGIDVSGYGIIDVNPTSGYTYLWAEDMRYSLYMPINCELCKDDVYILYTDSENGDEYETTLSDKRTQEIDEWIEEIETAIKNDDEKTLEEYKL